jgi:hypothetical protein
MASAFGKGY